MSDVPGFVGRTEAELYAEWKRHGRHLLEYGSELIETLFSVFCVVGVVAVFFGGNSLLSGVLPSVPLRLLLVGLALGGVGWLVALSPPGRLSGAHANPAVSLGFALLGKMHARDLWGYWAGQIAGAACSGLLGVATFGRLARQAHDASLRPGPGVGSWAALLGEVGATFALTYLVFTFVSDKRLARWTPAAAMLMVGALVWLDGNYSGAGMNPAAGSAPRCPCRTGICGGPMSPALCWAPAGAPGCAARTCCGARSRTRAISSTTRATGPSSSRTPGPPRRRTVSVDGIDQKRRISKSRADKSHTWSG